MAPETGVFLSPFDVAAFSGSVGNRFGGEVVLISLRGISFENRHFFLDDRTAISLINVWSAAERLVGTAGIH